MQMSIYLYLAIFYVATATRVFCAKAKRQQQEFSVGSEATAITTATITSRSK
ncbi:hypothetical protein [Lysinibacillus sp. JNUCC 51]|uniref:hypothetical protein n=1 Tax=Lysinibacillus sp. JNUCC-51 TaxID=2792479 RepID=UPI0019366CAB|nr:hypothetical protein JNUCC51_17225 [Lysinibacillus sp. JNUCC-51]